MKLMHLILLILPISACQNGRQKLLTFESDTDFAITKFEESYLPSDSIICGEGGCSGTYFGPEFINGSDVAHQFSNQMAEAVGNYLKKCYAEKKYSKVDLKNIKMSTQGLDNLGDVTYELFIPFMEVEDACLASTAFDHRGGWNHKITKSQAIRVFKNKKQLEFIELSTAEGLQEFWIQWQHDDFQKHCH